MENKLKELKELKELYKFMVSIGDNSSVIVGEMIAHIQQCQTLIDYTRDLSKLIDIPHLLNQMKKAKKVLKKYEILRGAKNA